LQVVFDAFCAFKPKHALFFGKPFNNFCTAIPTHNIAVGRADFEGPCCRLERPPVPAPALKGLKAWLNKSKTQWIEPPPRQSGDWRSREGVFFFGHFFS
jgi:hypothetical protein